MLDVMKYGPWAVVAGASEGLGFAFAQQIAQAGVNLVMVARRPDLLEAAAQQLREETGVQVRTLSVELSAPDILARLREVTDDIEVGLLVFNAAAANFKPLIEQNDEEILAPIRLSCVSQSLIAQHFGRWMVARGRGGLLLVSSLAGCAGIPNMAAYSGAKAYTQMFGEALWAELKPHGVDVFVLVVGSTDTPRRRASGAGAVPGIPVLTPEVVAAHGLQSLAAGPVQVPPPLQPIFANISTADRAAAVQLQRADIRTSDTIF
jgi:short-subunit dehydrogenase